MGVRDCGFIQLYSENNQEAYDNVIMAIKIAEEARLPVMVCYDGFITSHSVENITLMENEEVQKFVGTYKPSEYLLDESRNISIGPLDLQKHYFEHRKKIADAMRESKDIITKVSKEFAKITGRKYELYEKYNLDDAEIGIVVLNSTAGTAKEVVDTLRNNNVKAGLLKPRTFRPLPYKEIPQELKNLKALAILDKCDSVNGFSGPLFSEIISAMYSQNIHINTVNYIYGLGGYDVKEDDILNVFKNLNKIAKTGIIEDTTYYLGIEDGGETNGI